MSKVRRGLAILAEINVGADSTLVANTNDVSVLVGAQRSIAVDVVV